MAKVMLGPKQRIAMRRLMLEALAKASRKKNVTDDVRWRDIKKIDGLLYPNMIASWLLRLELIETRHIAISEWEVNFGEHQTQAKITQYGLWALENDRLTARSLQYGLKLPANTYQVLSRLAERLGIQREAGAKAGEVGSIAGLLGAVAAREEQFERWFRTVYAGEYKENGI